MKFVTEYGLPFVKPTDIQVSPSSFHNTPIVAYRNSKLSLSVIPAVVLGLFACSKFKVGD